MKNYVSILVLLFFGLSLFAQKESLNPELVEKVNATPVAVKSGGEYRVLKKNLRNTTPGGYAITKFRLLHSKNMRYSFLVQEYKHPRSVVYRYIPLERRDGEFFLSLERSSSFVDCWLMPCSTCEEVVSGTGGAWCECSVGGCSQTDTSDNWRDIVEYAYANL